MSGRPIPPRDLPRGVVEHYRKLSYQDYIPVAWYSASSPEELSGIVSTIEPLATEWAENLSEAHPTLARQELDSIERLGCNWRWKGYFPFPYTRGDELLFSNPEQAEKLEPYIKQIGVELMSRGRQCNAAELAAYARDTPYPINKGKGAPFFVPSTSRAGAIALASLTIDAGDIEDLEERCERLGGRVGLKIATYARIQATKKPRDRLIPSAEGEPLQSGMLAWLSRVRKVLGFPFVANYSLAEVGAAMLYLARSVPGLGVLPTIEDVLSAARKSRPECTVAEDLSNYDDRVGAETWSLGVTWIAEPVIGLLRGISALTQKQASLAQSVLDASVDMDIIIPPLSYSEAARVIPRCGGVPSGIRLTSVLNSFINLARVRYVLDYTKTSGRAFVFGDDTIVFFESSAAAAKFAGGVEEANSSVGFEGKLADDPSFLMRNVFTGAGYVGRMLLSTLQKEDTHEPRTLPIAALGLAARVSALKGHPDGDIFLKWARSGKLGDNVAAACSLAETLDFDVVALGHLVMNGVGRSETGASLAHSTEALVQIFDDAYGGTLLGDSATRIPDSDPAGSSLKVRVGEVLASARPAASLIRKEAEELYVRKGVLDLSLVRSTLAPFVVRT